MPVPLPALPDIAIYLKDEASHPTGSLKHRLARSLFLYALCNGWLREGMTVVEASSGSTAVSEAYFAKMLKLPFLAVMPKSTSAAKVAAIEAQGGECLFVDGGDAVYEAAEGEAAGRGGIYLDQFTNAERATDWRGNNNIAETIFTQMQREPCPVPAWIVCGAGTGGTSATIGRYIRFQRVETRLCVADPVQSVFHRHWENRSVRRVDGEATRIEGVGRKRLEPSFMPDVVDRMITVPDAGSIGAARALSRHMGRLVGGSTGMNMCAVAALASAMSAAGEKGSIVSILCDSGERYRDTLFDDAWVEASGLPIAAAEARMARFLDEGVLPPA